MFSETKAVDVFYNTRLTKSYSSVACHYLIGARVMGTKKRSRFGIEVCVLEGFEVILLAVMPNWE